MPMSWVLLVTILYFGLDLDKFRSFLIKVRKTDNRNWYIINIALKKA